MSRADLRVGTRLVGAGCEPVMWCGSDAKYGWAAREWLQGSIQMDMKAERGWAVAGC